MGAIRAGHHPDWLAGRLAILTCARSRSAPIPSTRCRSCGRAWAPIWIGGRAN